MGRARRMAGLVRGAKGLLIAAVAVASVGVGVVGSSSRADAAVGLRTDIAALALQNVGLG